MKNTDTLLKTFFEQSKREVAVSLKALEDGTAEFLEYYATASLVGQDFCAVIGDGDGRIKLARLLEASEYKQNPEGFFQHLLRQLAIQQQKKKHQWDCFTVSAACLTA